MALVFKIQSSISPEFLPLLIDKDLLHKIFGSLRGIKQELYDKGFQVNDINLKRDAKDLSRDLQRLEVCGKLESKTLYSAYLLRLDLPACRRLLFPFPRATKEIGDVCTQAMIGLGQPKFLLQPPCTYNSYQYLFFLLEWSWVELVLMLYWKATATAGNQTPPTTCGLGIVSEDWEYLLRIAPPSTRYTFAVFV